MHPQTARKQGCENDPEEESLFSNNSDNDHDDNDPDDDYSESTDDKKKKKKKKNKRKTPTSTIRTPGKTHWSGRTSPAAQEAANVLVEIGANPNVAKFMVSDGLDKITEIQELTSATILLYAKNSRKNTPRSDIVSTRFILDLEKAAFNMTHIKNRISHVINPTNINKTWCRSMNDQFDLEQGWKNEPLKDLYPTQVHLTNSTKWMEMLQNVLRMIRNANGAPLAAVIRKRIIPRPDSDDIAFGLQLSEYAPNDDKMIECAPILDRKTLERDATDKVL